MDFAKVPLRELISKEYAAERVKLIDRNRAAQQVACGRLKGSSDTTYLTAADSEGNMVSLIQSIYHGWGSGYVPDGLGFCLQNRGQLFALDPSHLNKLEPHKRPFHTIIPAFVTKAGRPVFSFGVMGGDFQPQGQSQVLMNLLDFGMSPQQAGEQPRIEHTESSTPTGTKMVGCGTVGFEKGIPDDVKLKLAYLGHRVRPHARPLRRLPGHLAAGRPAALLRRLRPPQRRLRHGLLITEKIEEIYAFDPSVYRLCCPLQLVCRERVSPRGLHFPLQRKGSYRVGPRRNAGRIHRPGQCHLLHGGRALSLLAP